MEIQKLGHCCLLVRAQGATVMTDPGNFSREQDVVRGVDFVLITHEHADHFHIDSLKAVLANNPQAVVVANASVARLLDEQAIPYRTVEDGEGLSLNGLSAASFSGDHAEIYPGIPAVLNTGFLLGGKFYFPGDAFLAPNRPVEVLALPVAGPWMRTADAVNFALRLSPKFAFRCTMLF